MTSIVPDFIDQVMREVMKGKRYQNIHPGLVRDIVSVELDKGRTEKEAIKATRNKLHQVGGAYLADPLPVEKWIREIHGLPHALEAQELKDFCQLVMQQHASTLERLPILEQVYNTVLGPLQPIHSILDLACGLNPFAQPWMPLLSDALYHACDIYSDMLSLVAAFHNHIGRKGEVFPCDLTTEKPCCHAQVAFLLKSLPCLEQVDKDIGQQLLEVIPADHILVSFPAHGLGGRSKGMLRNYHAHFLTLVEGKKWRIQEYRFPGELLFLVTR